MIDVNKSLGVTTPQFTVSYYKSAYTRYKNRDFRDVISMYERAEIDSYVSGCIMGRQSGFLKDWSIEPYEESQEAMNRAEFFRRVFEGLPVRRLFKGIMDARFKKYSVIHFEWGVVDGRQAPISAEKLEQKYFRYDPKDMDLKVDWGNRLEEIPEEALVCEIPDGEHPIMMPVLRDYILKEFGLESWAEFIDLFGHDIIIGKYPPGSDEAMKTAMETAVTTIARASRGTMPDNANIEIIGTTRNTGDHEKFTQAANKGLSISILGHANAAEDSNGMKIGQNDTAFRAKESLSIDDCWFIDENMQKLVKLIGDMNFGDGNYGFFKTNKAGSVNVAELIDALDLAYNHGARIHISNYKKLGIKVDETEEWLQKNDIGLGL